MTWPLVALMLGTGFITCGFTLGLLVLRTSARRQVSLGHIEERLSHLERRTAGPGEPMTMPRGLPARIR